MGNVSIRKVSVTQSLKWSALGQILPQLVNPIVQILIARCLYPRDFGLIAVATVIITFFELFLGRGFTTALVQKRSEADEVHKAADFIFTMNLMLSVVYYCIMVVGSPTIASFFNSPDSKVIIVVLSISVVFHALGDVQLALLQREMDFRSIFFRQIIPVGSQVVITLPLASSGYGVWALVFGKLVSDALATIVLWIKSEWKPHFSFEYRVHIELLEFAKYVIMTSFLGWTLVQGDSLIVGKFLSMKDLGLYKMAYDIDSKIFAVFLSPLIPVFYSRFCALGSDEEIKKYYQKLKGYVALLVFPLIVEIVVLCPYFEKNFLGVKWKGLSTVMVALSVTGVSNLWILLDSMFRALGKPRISARILLVNAAVYIPLWLFFVQFGFQTFLVGRVFMAILACSNYVYFELAELKTPILHSLQVYSKSLVAALVMLGTGLLFSRIVFQDYRSISSMLFVFVIINATYLALAYLFSQSELLAMKALVFGNKRLEI